MNCKGSSADIRDASAADPEKQTSLRTVVESYEDSFNTSTGNVKKDGSFAAPSWISFLTRKAENQETLHGVWWPEEALQRESVTYEASELEPLPGSNDGRLGKIRDDKYIAVTGCTKLTALHAKELQMKKQYASNEHGATSADMKAMYETAASAIGTVEATITPSATLGGESTIVVQTTGRIDLAVDSDDSLEDLLPNRSYVSKDEPAEIAAKKYVKKEGRETDA